MPDFINPYTFVPIPEEIPQREPVQRGDNTGVITCTMTIDSPTFIPNTTKKFACKVPKLDQNGEPQRDKNKKTKTDDHFSYDFYSYDNLLNIDVQNLDALTAPIAPVIPGSEIRGMIRNVYEQLTNSCFLITDENNLPYKRTPLPKTPAVLKFENGAWNLYNYADIRKADIRKVNYKSSQYLGQGEKIDIDADGNAKPNINGAYILHKTNNFKHRTTHGTFEDKHERAFTENPTGASTPVSADAVERLKNVIDSYCDEKVNKSKDTGVYYKDYRVRFNAKQPVLVYTDSSGTYLSPSQMTKEYFVQKIPQILEKQYEHHSCTDIEKLCPTCRLFGMIGKEGSVAGRVRFCDSHSPVGIKFHEPITLPVLGSPRISATEFYLQDPGSDIKMWNYDYAIEKYGNSSKGIPPEFQSGYAPELRGRKVYWQGNFNDKSAVKTNMNNTVRPLTSGTFEFKVYFEDLTDDELRQLVFCITLNGNNHRIGKGKPVGMGVVKVTADKIQRKSYSYESGNLSESLLDINLPKPMTSHNICETDTVKQILTYTAPLSEENKKLVQYPSANDRNGNPQTYEWFGKNRGPVSDPTIQNVLPQIDADIQTLPYDPKNSSNRGKSNQHSRYAEHAERTPSRDSTVQTGIKIGERPRVKNFDINEPAKADKPEETERLDEKKIKAAAKAVSVEYLKDDQKVLLRKFLDSSEDYPLLKDFVKKANKLLSSM
ncbi:hypothetical protein FACS1894105_00540 [Clostridia bacterium]|nr:hypothetical protein FACS1894105_00540 [Clostridia bacterium]